MIGSNLKEGVGVLIIDDDARFLIGKRKSSHGRGQLGFPGGNIEPGETYVDAALRETYEETGLKVSDPVVVFYVENDFPDKQIRYRTFFLLARYQGGEPQLKEPDKCEGWIWYDWDMLSQVPVDDLFSPINSLKKIVGDFTWLLRRLDMQPLPVKMISFDLDGTLVREAITLYFARLLGVEDKILNLESRFISREIDSTTYMNLSSEIMTGLSIDFIEQNLDCCPFIDNIRQVVIFLKSFGLKLIIVTTANEHFAKAIAKRFGFDAAFGTQFEVNPDRTIGNGIAVCSGADKIKHIKSFSQLHDISMNEILAVGDSLSDKAIFTTVGHSLAINYDEHLIGHADQYLRTDSLFDIIPLVYQCNILNKPRKKMELVRHSIFSMFRDFPKNNGLGRIYLEQSVIDRISELDSIGLMHLIIHGDTEVVQFIINRKFYRVILNDDYKMLIHNLELINHEKALLLKNLLLEIFPYSHKKIFDEIIAALDEILSKHQTKVCVYDNGY